MFAYMVALVSKEVATAKKKLFSMPTSDTDYCMLSIHTNQNQQPKPKQKQPISNLSLIHI